MSPSWTVPSCPPHPLLNIPSPSSLCCSSKSSPAPPKCNHLPAWLPCLPGATLHLLFWFLQVADYTSQGYSHQPPPSAAPHGDYWSQQPQSPAAPQSDYWAQQQQQEPAVKDSNYSAQPPVQGWDGLQGGYAQAQYGASATQPDQQYSSLASTYAPSQQQPGYGGSEPASWQVCYTPEGQQYWHNVATGMTQWETPAGMA
eukprot:CAMPEP_0117666504 /NCGR_PEP_ID=MMETSP0804-20121206/10415_1 /TAXON_ID=1074897 /ORGANISM="Tetraselmis astigmatica, Strain CCMP880" /LENGTH=199 /DNA_ID=CAMNT_0005474061 /DNA_START=99 /DNA_END=698 /DNA_ORIENTATION=+